MMSDQLSTSIITASARDLIPPSLQFANYMSLPLPVFGEQRLLIAFFVGRGEALNPELGYQIWPPSLLALFESATGQFYELRAVNPTNFSVDQPADQPMGQGVSPPEKNSMEYLQNELYLFQCCDAVIKCIRLKQPYESDLKRFDDVFMSLTESTLLPYYQKIRLAKVE
jgi:hypothetical protein